LYKQFIFNLHFWQVLRVIIKVFLAVQPRTRVHNVTQQQQQHRWVQFLMDSHQGHARVWFISFHRQYPLKLNIHRKWGPHFDIFLGPAHHLGQAPKIVISCETEPSSEMRCIVKLQPYDTPHFDNLGSKLIDLNI